jgi:hypothetical protein
MDAAPRMFFPYSQWNCLKFRTLPSAGHRHATVATLSINTEANYTENGLNVRTRFLSYRRNYLNAFP